MGSGITTNSGSITNLAAGGSNNTALTVGISTSTARNKSSAATIGLTSNGTIDGLANTTLTSQQVTVTGAAYDYANASVTSTPIAFGNVHVGDTVAQKAVTVANNTITNAAYQEGLNASFGSVGSGITTNSGSITNLAAGRSNNTALTVGISTSTAGNKSGTATIGLTSNGTIDGLANATLTSQQVTVTGAAYDYANASVTSTPIAFGNVHVGDTVAQKAVTVANNTITNAAYQEGLNASFGSVGSGITTNSGSITNLAAGGSNNTALTVGISTSTAGNKSGTATIGLTSNGTIDGLANTTLTSQQVTVTGAAYDYANASVTSTPIAFGNVHVGDTVAQKAVTVANNTITNAAYQEGLNARLSSAAWEAALPPIAGRSLISPPAGPTTRH